MSELRLPGLKPLPFPTPCRSPGCPLSRDPRTRCHPEGALWEGGGVPGAKAAWAEDVRHGERGQGEGGGTRKPGASAGSPDSKITGRGSGGGAPHTRARAHTRMHTRAHPEGVRSTSKGGRLVAPSTPAPPSHPSTLWGVQWDEDKNLSYWDRSSSIK